MRLCELAQILLKTQAHVLSHLAHQITEERMIRLLENIDYPQAKSEEILKTLEKVKWDVDPASNADEGEAYAELQTFVQKIPIPEDMKFYLWSFPLYRACVEHNQPLQSHAQFENDRSARELAVDLERYHLDWFEHLHIPEPIHAPLAQAIRKYWVSASSQILERLGLSKFILLKNPDAQKH